MQPHDEEIKLARFKLAQRAGRVKRCHTFDVIKEQSIGEHTYGVVNVLIYLCTDKDNVWNIGISPAILVAAVYHDTPEVITGDTPAPAKWTYPALEDALRAVEDRIMTEFSLHVSLTEFERRLLKFADIIDLALYSLHEAELGNATALRVADTCLQAIYTRDLHDLTTSVKRLFEHAHIQFSSIQRAKRSAP